MSELREGVVLSKQELPQYQLMTALKVSETAECGSNTLCGSRIHREDQHITLRLQKR